MQSKNDVINKTEILSNIKDRIAKHSLESYIHNKKEAVEKLTIAYQFGHMIGDEIFMRYLPSLACISMIETNVEYRVTDEEKAIFRSLEDKWYATKSQEDFKIQLDYYKSLERKYFPHILKCKFNIINVPDEYMDDFLNGVQTALWNCDACSYAIKNKDDIKMYQTDDYYFTIIELKLDV